MVSRKHLRRELSADDSHSLNVVSLRTCSPSSIKIASSIPRKTGNVKDYLRMAASSMAIIFPWASEFQLHTAQPSRSFSRSQATFSSMER